jgi:hypothetical protein
MHVPAFCGLVSRFESAVEVVIAVVSGSHHKRVVAVSVSPPKYIGGIVDCGAAVTVDEMGTIGQVCLQAREGRAGSCNPSEQCGAGCDRDGGVGRS